MWQVMSPLQWDLELLEVFLPQGNTGITGGETPLGSSSTTTSSGNPSLPTDPNCGLGGAPTGNGVCGSVQKLKHAYNCNTTYNSYWCRSSRSKYCSNFVWR